MAHIIPIYTTPLIATPCCPGSVGSSASDLAAPATPGSAAPQSGTPTDAALYRHAQRQQFRRDALRRALQASNLLSHRIQQTRDLLDRHEPDPANLFAPVGALVESISLALGANPAGVFQIFVDSYARREANAQSAEPPPKGAEAVPEEECPSPSSSGV